MFYVFNGRCFVCGFMKVWLNTLFKQNCYNKVYKYALETCLCSQQS